MAHRIITSVAAAAAIALFAGGSAQAQTQPVKKLAVARVQPVKAHRPVVIAEISDATFQKPLVIQKRSFLDPGNVVAPGQDTPANIVFNTDEHRQVYSSYNTAFFGNSELPDRFDLPPTNPRWNVSAQPHIPLPFDE